MLNGFPCFAMLFGLIALCACSPRPPKHGTAFVLEFGTNAVEVSTNAPGSLVRAQQVMGKRLKALGVRSYIEAVGASGIVVKVPAMDTNSLGEVRRVLSKAGKLEFRMVHSESDKLLAANLVEPGYEVLGMQVVTRSLNPAQNTIRVPYLVKKKAERGLTGSYIRRVAVTRSPATDAPEIEFELDEEGGRLFAELTREYMPNGNTYHQLAIVLDGQLYSAPRINEPIEGGRGMISGNFDIKEALALAAVLENPLEAPPRIVDEKTF